MYPSSASQTGAAPYQHWPVGSEPRAPHEPEQQRMGSAKMKCNLGQQKSQATACNDSTDSLRTAEQTPEAVNASKAECSTQVQLSGLGHMDQFTGSSAEWLKMEVWVASQHHEN